MSNQTSGNNKRIAKNSIYMSVRMMIVLIISLYATRAVLKVLGIEDYGIYNIVCGFVSMFSFLNTSMSSAAIIPRNCSNRSFHCASRALL